MNNARDTTRTLLWVVVAAVIAWGLYLTVGVFLSRPSRGLVVFGCFATFLAAWGLLLLVYFRKRRMAAKSTGSEKHHDG